MFRRCAAAGLALAALVVLPASAPAAAPLTPAGWRVDPAGTEIAVSQAATGFQGPMGAALSPDGRWLLGASSGAARFESADLFDLSAHQRTSFVGYDATIGQAAFYGAAWARDGQTAYVSGGGQNVIHVLHRDGGTLTETGTIAAPVFPAGLAYGRTPLGDRLYAVNNLSAIGASNPPGHQVSVIDPATNTVEKTIDLGTPLQPLGVALDRTGDKAYVTNWLGRSVAVIDTATEAKTGDVLLSPPDRPDQADHPSAVAANPVRDEVYTANSNSDTISVIDTTSDSLVTTIDVALVPGGPKGSNPIGLGVAPDGRRLYVALAGEDAIAVVDLDARETIGFIPTAWYPSAVSVTPNGRQLVITNANASGAGPNPCGGLTPLTTCANVPRDTQYTAAMIKGSVQVVDIPRNAGGLRSLTNEVVANNQVKARKRAMPRGARQIRHVIYVIRENRTYDQVFGDLPKGNGDPSLNLFKDESAPNARALAMKFGVFDNFYADAEVSAEGHNWITQANATDYVDKTYPINYSSSTRSRQRAYDFEDVPFPQQFATEPLRGDPTIPRSAAAQTGGYLWDNAFAHGVSFRDYGEYTQTDCQGAGNVSHTTHLDDTRFGDHVDERFPGYNLSCSDHVLREPEWEREFRQYEKDGNLPALEFVRLPSDHTNGTGAGRATPQSYVADNDLAVGRLVDAVSHSRFWKSTAIFITEDDAQNGPDHVDAHRTLALVVSPYTQAGKVDSTHLSTSSMLATMEDLLGLPPMAVTDARANRMWGAFVNKPDTTPYEAIQPEVVPFGDPGAPTNGANAPMARESAKWNFKDADETPEIALNKAIWKSVKGRHAKMPAPRHGQIIGSRPNEEGDAAESDGDG